VDRGRFGDSAGPLPEREDGATETTRVANALLMQCPAFRGRREWVRCHCQERCLFLEGFLPTFYLKQLAQEAVRRVPGIDRIVNRIVVANLWEDSSRSTG
jgi:hypothetical protein